MASRGNVVTIAQSVQLTTEECCNCGVIFGMPSYMRTKCVETHRTFYCPNGHAQSYNDETAAEKAERLLQEEQVRHQRTLAQKNEAEVRERAAKTALERARKRIKNGVCPCCKRSFKALAAHMKSQHPDFAS